MEREVYFKPETCIPGKSYYMKARENGTLKEYRSVEFVGYRPHPAEVIVRDGSKMKIIRRIYLLQKSYEE